MFGRKEKKNRIINIIRVIILLVGPFFFPSTWKFLFFGGWAGSLAVLGADTLIRTADLLITNETRQHLKTYKNQRLTLF